MVIIPLLGLVPRKHMTFISSSSPWSVSSSSAYEPQNTNGAGVEKPDTLVVCWDPSASTAAKVQINPKVAQGSFRSSQSGMGKRWTVILPTSPGVGIHMQLPKVQWDTVSPKPQQSHLNVANLSPTSRLPRTCCNFAWSKYVFFSVIS